MKEAREARDRARASDPTQTRLSSILNLSVDNDLAPIVSDDANRKGRDYIYAHRESQGGTKKDEETGKINDQELDPQRLGDVPMETAMAYNDIAADKG